MRLRRESMRKWARKRQSSGTLAIPKRPTSALQVEQKNEKLAPFLCTVNFFFFFIFFFFFFFALPLLCEPILKVISVPKPRGPRPPALFDVPDDLQLAKYEMRKKKPSFVAARIDATVNYTISLYF